VNKNQSKSGERQRKSPLKSPPEHHEKNDRHHQHPEWKETQNGLLKSALAGDKSRWPVYPAARAIEKRKPPSDESQPPGPHGLE